MKVWDKREFRNLDDTVELGTRNLKVALRRLRSSRARARLMNWICTDTIESTARNAGMLDIKMVPERHNAVKVLLFLDVGGSMDDHVRVCEELFSAARGEFKHLEYFYFHNCVYEGVWKDNRAAIGTHADDGRPAQVLRRLQADLRRRCDHEPLRDHYPGGSVEHWNEEAGSSLDETPAGYLSESYLAEPGAQFSAGNTLRLSV